ncbi:MAG: hypothetical protein EOO50_07935 [Flavobacterium sp.]|uniref:hypothetical protein n=1 Tax=Flavobacterium sp. TaxID=239 RepID=UPI0012049031|nr:hypothetical protein [Flavobacterium sp.]RZJ66808.1 MAG: hypothetical protein EOO50_07935 [Flavobacterium sp.]
MKPAIRKTRKAILILCMLTSSVFAQKRTVLTGDYKNLKGISAFNVIFDYENLTVDKSTEEEFLKDRMDKREGEKSQQFREGWFADRQNRYEPKFIESFNKRFDDGQIKADKNFPDAKYTMKVKTIWIHPGFNAGVVRSTSAVTFVVSIYETANPDNVLLSVEFLKVAGKGAMGFDYNSGYRISESYAKLAKEFANDIRKNTK